MPGLVFSDQTQKGLKEFKIFNSCFLNEDPQVCTKEKINNNNNVSRKSDMPHWLRGDDKEMERDRSTAFVCLRAAYSFSLPSLPDSFTLFSFSLSPPSFWSYRLGERQRKGGGSPWRGGWRSTSLDRRAPSIRWLQVNTQKYKTSLPLFHFSLFPSTYLRRGGRLLLHLSPVLLPFPPAVGGFVQTCGGCNWLIVMNELSVRRTQVLCACVCICAWQLKRPGLEPPVNTITERGDILQTPPSPPPRFSPAFYSPPSVSVLLFLHHLYLWVSCFWSPSLSFTLLSFPSCSLKH